MNSPEQTPTNQKLSVRPADLPPSQQTAESYDKTAKFPREHRDNKGETRRLSTGARIAIGMLATGVITGGTILGYAAKQTADFKSNLDDLIDEPSSSAPANPGETQPIPENIGIELTDDQLERFQSGERDEVIDEVLIQKLDAGLNDPSKLVDLTADPTALDDLTFVSNDAFSHIEGEAKVLTVCGTAAADYTNDPAEICYKNPSKFPEDGDTEINLYVYDTTGSGVPKGLHYTLENVDLDLDGNKLVIK